MAKVKNGARLDEIDELNDDRLDDRDLEREVEPREVREMPGGGAEESTDERIVMSQGNADLSNVPTTVPVLALRDVVIFPFMIFPVLVGRESSLSATSAAVARDNKYIFLVAQKNSNVDEPTTEDLYRSGTLA